MCVYNSIDFNSHDWAAKRKWGFRAQVVRCAVVEKLLRTSLLLINRKNVHRIRATLVWDIWSSCQSIDVQHKHWILCVYGGRLSDELWMGIVTLRCAANVEFFPFDLCASGWRVFSQTYLDGKCKRGDARDGFIGWWLYIFTSTMANRVKICTYQDKTSATQFFEWGKPVIWHPL